MAQRDRAEPRDMKFSQLPRRQRILVQCAPINQELVNDRGMRGALSQARKTEDFAHQENFDRAVVDLVRAIPIPPDIAEWFSPEHVISGPRRAWQRLVRNPAILAIGLALAVIAGVFTYQFLEHLHDFPGATKARKLLEVARSTKSVLLEPVKTSAGTLGDLFFMKSRLERYDVPEEFAELRTIGWRVFDDEEGQRIAQVWVSEKRMQFFLFPAEKNPKTGAPLHFTGWRYVEHEGWTGVVHEASGVCFMASLRGREKDLAPYVSKSKD